MNILVPTASVEQHDRLVIVDPTLTAEALERS